MKSEIGDSLENLLKASFISAVLVSAVWSATAQPVTLLAVRPNGNQVAISWPADLGLVQPQRSTNLAAGGWQDFGAAITNSTLLDATGVGAVFYRLRFLAPSIITQPQGHGVVAGAGVTLNVSASGTAPLSYQWRKSGTDLASQTSEALSLNAVTLGDAGDYTVLVANRAGAATSVVATLTVTSPPLATPPRGIYLGNFSGQTNGGFAAMVRSNALAVVLGQIVPQNEGVLVTNVAVAPDGSFSLVTEKAGKISGMMVADSVSGTLLSTNGTAGTFSAARKPDSGIHQANAGYYAGTFGGLLTGNAFFILAADGAAFVYLLSPTLGGGGAFGAIDSANSLAATAAYTLPGTTVPALIEIKGTLNPATRQFTGTYGLGMFALGTFSLTRIFAL